MRKFKYTPPEPYVARSLELVSCLSSEPSYIELLFNRGKPYEILLDLILNIDPDEDKVSIKGIASQLGIKTATVTKWIHTAYDDIWQLNYEEPMLFRAPGKRYELFFNDGINDPSDIFSCWLDVQFNQYDRFAWRFVGGRIGYWTFYVSKVSHKLSKTEIETTVQLTTGVANRYRDSLIEQAEFLNLLSWDELRYLPSFQLDKLLKERVVKNNRGYKLDN